MPRPRATEPREEQLLIRITARELRILRSVAHLEGDKSPNAYAYRLLAGHLESMARNHRVQTDLKNRDAYDADAKKATPLQRQQGTFSRDEVRDATEAQRRATRPSG